MARQRKTKLISKDSSHNSMRDAIHKLEEKQADLRRWELQYKKETRESQLVFLIMIVGFLTFCYVIFTAKPPQYDYESNRQIRYK